MSWDDDYYDKFKEYFEKYSEEEFHYKRIKEQKEMERIQREIERLHQDVIVNQNILSQPRLFIKTDEEELVELETKVEKLKKKIHEKYFKDKMNKVIDD